MGGFAKDSSTITKQDFNQNVGEVLTYSGYILTYSSKLRDLPRNKRLPIHLVSFLVMSRQWWPTNTKDICSVTLCRFVPVLNALVRKSFGLLEFNQTHEAALFSSKYKTFPLQVRNPHMFAGHSLRVNVGESLYVVPINRCAFWFLFNHLRTEKADVSSWDYFQP